MFFPISDFIQDQLAHADTRTRAMHSATWSQHHPDSRIRIGNESRGPQMELNHVQNRPASTRSMAPAPFDAE